MNKQKCLVESCTNIATLRGLCQSCYANAANLVRANKTTWEFLESKGLSKPKGSKSNAFKEAFLSASSQGEK